MNNFIKNILFALPLLATFSAANATPITDIREFVTPGPGTTYFLDSDANKLSSPYYRSFGQDWGWTQGTIAATFTSATLQVSAFDVDAQDPHNNTDEIDTISAYDGSSWVTLGTLAGNNNIWAFTTFDLTPYLATWATTQINSGLMLKINIDQNQNGWLVTLAKSTLSVDGGNQSCSPTPGVPCSNIPEPESITLFGLGLTGLALSLASRRKKA